jgi:hypothetical protein
MMSAPVVDRGDAAVSSTVVEAVAAATETDPLALDPPLYRVVDGEALDALARCDGGVTIRFEYVGHSVVVRPDGTVVVDGTTHEPDGDGSER